VADIGIFTITKDGGAPTLEAAASGDTAVCGPGYFLVARNTNGASRDLTIAVPGNTSYGQANPDVVYTLDATTGEEWIPLLDAYRDPTDQRAHISYSATAGVTVGVVKR
jgi:hypothetical protein